MLHYNAIISLLIFFPVLERDMFLHSFISFFYFFQWFYFKIHSLNSYWKMFYYNAIVSLLIFFPILERDMFLFSHISCFYFFFLLFRFFLILIHRIYVCLTGILSFLSNHHLGLDSIIFLFFFLYVTTTLFKYLSNFFYSFHRLPFPFCNP